MAIKATKGFEYKTASRSLTYGEPYEAPDGMLSDFGHDGWELVHTSIIPSRMLSSTMYEIWYFKREIQIP